MSDAWYLDADDYWVDPADAGDYPLRQGDIVAGHFFSDDLEWDAAMIVHPTCELPKKAVTDVQVVEVRLLDTLPDDFQKGLVVAGYQEKDGHRQVAVAHTFFVAPLPGAPEPRFANFRELRNVPKEKVTLGGRAAAMTHDCRVSFIRRWTYFRFRQAFSMNDVRTWEAARIQTDPFFAGPKPPWAV